MTATKLDFFAALKQAVMFSPANDMKCRQLQTFRVLEQGGGALVSADNFGATICDKDKPYFWSRRWHELKYNPDKIQFEFPALAVIERSYTINRPMAKHTTRCYEFNISVMDVYTADCDKMKCSGCTGRTINEIYEDTEKMLFSALHFVSRFIGATLPNGTEGFYHEDILAAWKASGYITSWAAGKGWGGSLAQNVQGATAYKAAIPAAGLFGNSITVNVCFDNCEATEYDFTNFADFGLLSQNAGCSTCG